MLIRWTDEALSAGSKPSTLRWLDDDDRGEADDEDEEKDATADASTAVGKERKSSGAARPPVRRRRYTKALQRRLELVAPQIISEARVRRVRAVDHHLVLANKHKMVYPNDKLFDPKEFFEHADPGAIELESDAVSADADGEDEVDGDAGAEPATRPRPRVRAQFQGPAPRAYRRSPASRAKSPHPNSTALTRLEGHTIAPPVTKQY